MLGTVVGGVPMSLMPGGSTRLEVGEGEAGGVAEAVPVGAAEADGVAEAEAPGLAVSNGNGSTHEQATVPAAACDAQPPPVAAMTQITAPRTTAAATPAPIRACRTRLRRAASARAAISRSSRARAAARWRLSRSELTAVLPRSVTA